MVVHIGRDKEEPCERIKESTEPPQTLKGTRHMFVLHRWKKKIQEINIIDNKWIYVDNLLLLMVMHTIFRSSGCFDQYVMRLRIEHPQNIMMAKNG